MTEFRTGLTLYITIPYDIDLPICLLPPALGRGAPLGSAVREMIR